jgi:hypothetical protein
VQLLSGKGLWLQRIAADAAGDLDAVVARARAAGLAHVIVKVADGAEASNLDPRSGRDLAAELARRLAAAGLAVWGWHSLYGEKPAFKGAYTADYHRREAEAAVTRLDALLPAGLGGLVLEARGEYERSPARARKAAEFLAALPDIPLALSAWKSPAAHPRFPWAEFRSRCQLDMPPVFWVGRHGEAARQLRAAVRQFHELTPARPLAATGPAFFEANWRPTPNDLLEFLQTARALDLPAVNLWLWDQLGFTGDEPVDLNPRRLDFRPLWQTFAAYAWPGAEAAPGAEPRPADFERAPVLDDRSEPSQGRADQPAPIDLSHAVGAQVDWPGAPALELEAEAAEAHELEVAAWAAERSEPEPAGELPLEALPEADATETAAASAGPADLASAPPEAEPEPVPPSFSFLAGAGEEAPPSGGEAQAEARQPVGPGPARRIFLSPAAGTVQPAPATVARFFKALRLRQLDDALALYAVGFAHVTPARVTHERPAVRVFYADLLARLRPGGPLVQAVAGTAAAAQVHWSAETLDGAPLAGVDDFHLNRAGEIVYHHSMVDRVGQ